MACAVSSGGVVAADELRIATVGSDLFYDLDSGIRVDRAGHVAGQGFAGVLIDQVADLEPSPVSGGVELEIGRPHLIRMLGVAPVGRHGRGTLALPFAAVRGTRRPSSRHTPLNLLAMHRIAHLARFDVRASVPPARPLPGEQPQPATQLDIRIRQRLLIALGGPRLTDHPARTPLRHAQPLLQHAHDSASACRA